MVARFSTTRRALLGGTGATAVLGAAGQLFPSGAHAQGAGPETSHAVLAFIPLVDAAPLIVAKEKGFFAKHGMGDVELVKAASWNEVKRGLSVGGNAAGYDGAHLMSSLAYLMQSGQVNGQVGGGAATPMHLIARMNTNGQAISLAKSLIPSGARLSSAPLKPIFADKRGHTLAITIRGGTHDLWLRYWLAAGGIEPETEVGIATVPPPDMMANTQVGIDDGFCVGEPWNAMLVDAGGGFTACLTSEMWADHPEKAFAMRADWVARYPRATAALTAAVIEGQVWADDPNNAAAVADLLAKPAYLKIASRSILPRMAGEVDYGDGRTVHGAHHVKFWADHASYPFQSHDLWFLTEGIRWGVYPPDLDTKALITAVNREDIWRTAAKMAGVPGGDAALPKSTSRGPEKFFDGKVFDPANPKAYLDSQTIKQMMT